MNFNCISGLFRFARNDKTKERHCEERERRSNPVLG